MEKIIEKNLNYIQIPEAKKGIRNAFQKGWYAAKEGFPKEANPYDPREKDFYPTNPYYIAWAKGWESYCA